MLSDVWVSDVSGRPWPRANAHISDSAKACVGVGGFVIAKALGMCAYMWVSYLATRWWSLSVTWV